MVEGVDELTLLKFQGCSIHFHPIYRFRLTYQLTNQCKQRNHSYNGVTVNENVVNHGLSYVIYYSNLFDSKSLELGVYNRGIDHMIPWDKVNCLQSRAVCKGRFDCTHQFQGTSPELFFPKHFSYEENRPVDHRT